jgi:hypothetical protein
MQSTRNYVPAAASDVAPINRPTVVLIERGHAVRQVYRLSRQLAGLAPDDRHAVLALLAELVGDVEPSA